MGPRDVGICRRSLDCDALEHEKDADARPGAGMTHAFKHIYPVMPGAADLPARNRSGFASAKAGGRARVSMILKDLVSPVWRALSDPSRRTAQPLPVRIAQQALHRWPVVPVEDIDAELIE